MQTGVFPEEMKTARVTAIFKGGEVSDLGNYRPITVFCCCSKILEKIMFNRLKKHLLNSNILCKKQIGFQENHSTDYAIINQLIRLAIVLKKSFYLRCIYGFVKGI